jgi:uncharacterized protein YbcC (UPF0753/DUF2309 family)
LFHGKGFLPRKIYRRYLDEGKIDIAALAQGAGRFAGDLDNIDDIDMCDWLVKLFTEIDEGIMCRRGLATDADIGAALRDETTSALQDIDSGSLTDQLCGHMLSEKPLYESIDLMFGTGIGEELDELVIKSCLDFFDEGQSVWQMPDRELGFFHAWRQVARRNARLFLRGRNIRETLEADDSPEGVIVHVMDRLKIPQERWMQYFRSELSRLHGWAGFIRWRSTARHYYQGRMFPGDLVDFLAVRLTLALSLINDRGNDGVPADADQLDQFIRKHPAEACLRQVFYGHTVLPDWAQRIETTLLSGDRGRIDTLGVDYISEERKRNALVVAASLRELATRTGQGDVLDGIDDDSLARLLDSITRIEAHEGMLWLKALEATAMQRLLDGIGIPAPATEEKRPFAQALFCIDTRSERLRRHLESVGDYQTFGIAGFFGVPVSFMELGKGSETHMCPVLLTPKNLVMEMSVDEVQDTVAVTAIEKALHELKESVLTPFVTVEAIGLFFGFDMVGKTIAPSTYNRWRSHLHDHKPHTHLLIDKLSKEQADSIVRAVQRAVIAKAVEQEFKVAAEHIKDDMVRELREVAMGHSETAHLLKRELGLSDDDTAAFIGQLRNIYRINAAYVRMQMERLGRIGFTLEEQVVFVSQALHAIGLTDNFSRFILIIGHGSHSENNPYESALDCGACGGNLGLYNARIFANMANKPAVRQRLREQGIDIPDDAWFVPALHNTTTDEVAMHDLDLLPSSHPVYLDRLQKGLVAACRLCTQERIPGLDFISGTPDTVNADKQAVRNAMDWSQVRPEWGLSRNAYFIIGRRAMTRQFSLDGRAFLHSYDYRVDRKLRLLENILTGPLVVGQWINMEHYFSTVDNEHYGSGSKVYHNVAGRFGVMTGNLSDLRTGLPAQTVLAQGEPYHEPMRLITVIEAPFKRVIKAFDSVSVVRRLLINGWIRMMIIDPESGITHLYDEGEWQEITVLARSCTVTDHEAIVI